MFQSSASNFVPVSELVVRGEAFVSGPATQPGRSASEFLASRKRYQTAALFNDTPRNTLPAVFEELRCRASRMKLQRIGAKAPGGNPVK